MPKIWYVILVWMRCVTIDQTMPWALAKEEDKKDRLATVLYNLLESIRISAVLLKSFLPETADKILDTLHTNQRDFDSIQTFGQLETGIQVEKKPEVLFARIDEKKFMEELNKELEAQKEEKPKKEEIKEEITIDDFSKVELKVGTIIECEKHPKADRLLVEKIDMGEEIRQVVSGIANTYKPEELIGKQVIVVTNLKPVKLRGVDSNGMILCASSEKGLSIISPVTEMPNGTVVR